MDTMTAAANTDMLPDYADTVAALATAEPELASAFATFQGVTSVLNWMKPRSLASTRST